MFLTSARLDTVPEGVPDIPVVRSLASSALTFTAPITILTGENGAGKSTLLEALAAGMGFNAEGGSRNVRFSATSEPMLHHSLVLTRTRNPRDGFFLRGESWLATARHYEELGPSPMDDLLEMSHGQSLMELIRRRFHTDGLFFLDEPEAGLSVLRQLELLGMLYHLAEGGSQIILATHSPVLMEIPGAQILEIGEAGITPAEPENTNPVTAMVEFIDDPEGTADFLVEGSYGTFDPFLRDYQAVPGDAPEWVDDVPAFRALRAAGRLEFQRPVTLITGENGVGKSSLVEGMAVSAGFNSDGGPYRAWRGKKDNPLRKVAAVSPGNRLMNGYFLRAEAHFGVSTTLMTFGHSLDSLHHMSHGESVLHVIRENFHADGLYLLDEPEAGLSAVRQMTLLAELHQLAAAGAQIICATHSPILLGIPGADIWEFTGEGEWLRGVDMRETTAFRAMRDFLADPAGVAQFMVEVAGV